jgi:hypothetical protein
MAKDRMAPSGGKKESFFVRVTVLALVIVAAALGLRALRPPRPPFKRPPTLGALDPKAVARVSASYNKDVQPLFKAACFDCHTTQTVWPWYHALPGVKQYIEHHAQEGLHDLDITDGVPFKGDAPLDRQLLRISRQVGRGGMPLWDYKLMHPDARLTDEQRATIVAWADASYADLSSTAGPAPAQADGQAAGGWPRH